MESRYFQSWVLVVYCTLVVVLSCAAAPTVASCRVKFPAHSHRNCSRAWMIDINNADLAPFINCNRKSSSYGEEANKHSADGRFRSKLTFNKSLCAQIDIDVADLTWVSVQICQCLNCFVEMKTPKKIYGRDNWPAPEVENPGSVVTPRTPIHMFCLRQFLSAGSRTSCHIRDLRSRQIVSCQSRSAYSATACFRVWWQRRRCEGYLKCKALTSKHTCESLLEGTTVKSLLPLNTDENTINFGDPKLLPQAPFPRRGLHSTYLSLKPGGYSGVSSCPTCPTLRRGRQAPAVLCKHGWFGPRCDQACNCRHEVNCHSDGTCPYGVCATGWRGSSCSDRVCPDGKYGATLPGKDKCSLTCKCPHDTQCHTIHGACTLSSCRNATLGASTEFSCFEQVCSRHRLLFTNCSQRCYCSQDAVCDSVSGVCPTMACSRRYKRPTCHIPLIENLLYGQGIALLAFESILLALKMMVLMKIRLIPLLTRSVAAIRK